MQKTEEENLFEEYKQFLEDHTVPGLRMILVREFDSFRAELAKKIEEKKIPIHLGYFGFKFSLPVERSYNQAISDVLSLIGISTKEAEKTQ